MLRIDYKMSNERVLSYFLARNFPMPPEIVPDLCACFCYKLIDKFKMKQ
jgi:hypothetical protein